MQLRCLSKSLANSHFAVNPDLKNCFIDSAPDLQHPLSPVAGPRSNSSQGLERTFEKRTLIPTSWSFNRLGQAKRFRKIRSPPSSQSQH